MLKTPSAPKRRGRKPAAAKTTKDADTMNSTRSSSRRSKAVDSDVSAETITADETLNSTRSGRSSRAASKVRQSPPPSYL